MVRAYDTLDDLDTSGATNIADVYELVIGAAMCAEDLAGVVTSGPLNQSQSQGGYWGRYPLSFSDHPEVWYVRSAPAGRMGKPLFPEEVRQVSVLVRQSSTSKDSRVTNIKLWLLPDSEKLHSVAVDPRQRDRGRFTHGPMGVSAHGINLFEHRTTPTTTFAATCNTHTVLPTVASVTTEGANCHVYRVESAMTPHYIIAASLIGLAFPETPARHYCEQRYTSADWDSHCTGTARAFKHLATSQGSVVEPETYLKLLFTAEDVCEQMSFIGYLDQRADAFYAGAQPDDMHKPSGLPLMVCIAVCIASNPGRWGLSHLVSDDAFATKETALFIESVLPSITALGVRVGGNEVGGEQVHSFDVVVNYALAQIKCYITKLQSGQLDGNMGGVDHRRVETAMKASLLYLFRTGTAVCVDLFGLCPHKTAGSAGLYTTHGIASQLVDPVMASRAQSAYDLGIGNTVSRWPTLRTSTRGKRQLALAGVLVDVDRWLKTGKYKGVVLHPTAQASVSVRPEELDPTSMPAPPMPATAAATAAATATRSAKKKKRPESLLAERGKLRGAMQQQGASDAMRSMFRNGTKDDDRRVAASDKLCGEALQSASAIFSDILQQGACAGMGDLFELTTYLVTPTSNVRCAHCENSVNVVQSTAFSGIFGMCCACRHPRCLECVSHDIATSSEPQLMSNCHFCCGALSAS